MKFQAYTDGEDTIYGASAEEAVAAYMAEVGLTDPGDFGAPEDFKLVPGDKIQKVTDDETDKVESRTIDEWIQIRQSEPRKSRMICTSNW